MNKVTISGFLANNPELKTIKRENKQDLNLTNFVLKERKYRNGKVTNNFLPCVAVGTVAQNLTKYKKINDFITVSGKLITRSIAVPSTSSNIPTNTSDNSKAVENQRGQIVQNFQNVQTNRQINITIVLAGLIEWPIMPKLTKAPAKNVKDEDGKLSKNVDTSSKSNESISIVDTPKVTLANDKDLDLSIDDIVQSSSFITFEDLIGTDGASLFDDNDISDIVETSKDDLTLNVNQIDIF